MVTNRYESTIIFSHSGQAPLHPSHVCVMEKSKNWRERQWPKRTATIQTKHTNVHRVAQNVMNCERNK